MTLFEPPPSRLFVRPWSQPVLPPSFYPASLYIEYCWLPIFGPSTTWLYRHLGQLVITHPGGVLVDLPELALEHGLGHSTGRHGPLTRSLLRLVKFGAATTEDDILLVRPKLPAVPDRHLVRLTAKLKLIESHLRAGAESDG